MVPDNRERDRFWIALTIRLAFGFMFAIAALNIFTYYESKSPPPGTSAGKFVAESVVWFATDLSKPYEKTWMNFKWRGWPLTEDAQTGAVVAQPLGIYLVKAFLYTMPFLFTVLAFCLLSGLFLFPALRFSAIYMVVLGLGKYVTGDTATTAQDFLFAVLILVCLYMAAGPKESDDEAEFLGVHES